MRTLLTLPLLFAATAASATVAHADGGPPGACSDCYAPGYGPQGYGPQGPAAPAAAPVSAVMAHRFAVSVGMAAIGLATQSTPDAVTNFSGGTLGLRFRLTPGLELEGNMSGGREQLKAGGQGDLETTIADFGVRMHFRPESAWDIYALGGVGAALVVSHSADSTTRSQASRRAGQLGVGLERRWEHFGLHAEVRMIVVAAADNNAVLQGAPPMTTGGAPQPGVPTMPPVSTPIAGSSEAMNGGMFTLGASYYF
jgi:hypothetical protein